VEFTYHCTWEIFAYCLGFSRYIDFNSLFVFIKSDDKNSWNRSNGGNSKVQTKESILIEDYTEESHTWKERCIQLLIEIFCYI